MMEELAATHSDPHESAMDALLWTPNCASVTLVQMNGATGAERRQP